MEENFLAKMGVITEQPPKSPSTQPKSQPTQPTQPTQPKQPYKQMNRQISNSFGNDPDYNFDDIPVRELASKLKPQPTNVKKVIAFFLGAFPYKTEYGAMRNIRVIGGNSFMFTSFIIACIELLNVFAKKPEHIFGVLLAISLFLKGFNILSGRNVGSFQFILDILIIIILAVGHLPYANIDLHFKPVNELKSLINLDSPDQVSEANNIGCSANRINAIMTTYKELISADPSTITTDDLKMLKGATINCARMLKLTEEQRTWCNNPNKVIVGIQNRKFTVTQAILSCMKP